VRFPAYRSHFLIGVLLLICLVCINLLLGVSSLAQSDDDTEIKVLVEKLFELYQRKDLDGMISLWSEQSPFTAKDKQGQEREFAAYEKIAVGRIDIRQKKIDGDKATLRVAIEIAATRAKLIKATEKLEKKNRTIALVKEGSTWKIWKYNPSELELVAAIMSAKSEEERNALLEKEPELITSDLAIYLGGRVSSSLSGQVDYQRALTLYQLAASIGERAGDQYSIASSLLNIGYVHGWIGTPEKSPELSLEYYRKSLKLGEQFGFKDIMARSSVSCGQLYQTLGELSLASEFYQKGLKTAEELGERYLTLRARTNLAAIYHARGNYSRALELLLKSLELAQSRLISGEDWMTLSYALVNIGGIFADQGNDEQALAYYQRADEAAQKGINLGDAHANAGKADVLFYMGKIYQQKGDYSLALECYQKSLLLMEKFGIAIGGAKDGSISALKVAIGDLMAAKNNNLEAIHNYQDALKLAEKIGYRSEMTDALSNLGRIYLLQGNYREALAFSERAIAIAEAGELPTKTCQALLIAAKIQQKLGLLDDARRSLARAIDLTEKLRELYAGGELDRQRSFEIDIAPYQAMIDLEVDQKQFKKAFSYAQMAKARTLLELLQKGKVDLTKSTSSLEREQEQQLSHKIFSLNRQMTGEKLKLQPDEKRIAEVEEQLRKARLEFEAFETTLYAAHPELKVQRGEIRQISLNDTAQLIPDSRTVLLDFIVTDDRVHLFALTKEASSQPSLNSYIVRIERKSLAEMVERFRRRLANRDYDFQRLSRELYDLLLKPAQRQLQNKTTLIISPDNLLWDLPFQSLLSPALHYLIEDCAISYAPSLSVLREMRLVRKNKQEPVKATLLALGNPALGERSRELTKFVKMDAELQPLPEAAAQVQALGQLYGKSHSHVYVGQAAREEVIKEQSARYRILHLATHGILNDVSPMYSHVLLSQTSGKSDEDGLLEAWEMMNLDLNADLVVLSACETARGRVGAGEGVIGMTWALFVAGCPRTVVSQWKVEASSTTALMVEFHKGFKTRYGGPGPVVSTAEAMRQAALKMMKNPEYAHPFYWGGFVITGDGN
jgi:CHAT domain-containing protein/TPR repeat protein